MITETRRRFGGFGTRVLEVPGDGPPVLLLHGYADSADTWVQVLRGFGEMGQRALAVDLPGFGQAGARAPGPLVDQFDMFARSLLDDMGPAVLVGNSLGAATAVRAATRQPDSVVGLVALDDPVNARHWLARLARLRPVPASVWSGVARIRVPAPAVRWATGLATRRILYGPGAVVDPGVVRRWCESAAAPGALETLGRYAFQYAVETDGGHREVEVSCPTLIVHGARDRIIPVHASQILHQQIPGSDLVVLPQSGHCPQLDDPAAVVRLTMRLLEKIRR